MNSGEEIYRAMDQNFEGKSQMIPVEIKKNGEISTARSKVASTEEFAVITRYVEHEIRQCGEAIYAGNIAVNPYRSDIETSCTYCPYASVCGMDAKIPGYEYRQFASMKKKKCLTRCRQSLPETGERRSDQMKWTKEQQNVIDFRNRDILVSAAAGSGKTAVLVARIIQGFSTHRIRLISTGFWL